MEQKTNKKDAIKTNRSKEKRPKPPIAPLVKGQPLSRICDRCANCKTYLCNKGINETRNVTRNEQNRHLLALSFSQKSVEACFAPLSSRFSDV